VTLGLAIGLPLLAVVIVGIVVALKILRKGGRWRLIDKSLELNDPINTDVRAP
jgi:thiol:disulfide interchange protein